jgi:ankyrin repeat protein
MEPVIEFFDAIKLGRAGEVTRLLTLDPSLIHSMEEGLSPVLAAAYHQQPELANFLAEKKVSLTIFEAAATGKTDAVIRILAREPGLIKSHAADGAHPLGLACFFGHFETALYLLKAGAAVNAPSRNALQVTPLHSAAEVNHLKIVNLLLVHRADPNTRKQGGLTPLHLAAVNGNVDIIRALLFGGADMDLRSDDGQLAVELALTNSQEEAAKLLLEGITRRIRLRRPAS